MDIIYYVALGIGLAAPAGPINIELLNRGLKFGFYPACFFGLGAITANLCFQLIIYFGALTWWQLPIVEVSNFFIGALVLLWLGFSSIHSVLSNKKLVPSPSNIGSFVIGGIMGFANPINFMSWYSGYGMVLHTWLLYMSILKIGIMSLLVLIGVCIWYSNLVFLTHFIKRKINFSLVKTFIFINGIMHLWYCSEYLRKIAEIVWNW